MLADPRAAVRVATKADVPLLYWTAVAWGDSYRRPFELISPVSGEVVAINASLLGKPTHINAYPYATEGMLTLRIKTPEEVLSYED